MLDGREAVHQHECGRAGGAATAIEHREFPGIVGRGGRPPTKFRAALLPLCEDVQAVSLSEAAAANNHGV